MMSAIIFEFSHNTYIYIMNFCFVPSRRSLCFSFRGSFSKTYLQMSGSADFFLKKGVQGYIVQNQSYSMFFCTYFYFYPLSFSYFEKRGCGASSAVLSHKFCTNCVQILSLVECEFLPQRRTTTSTHTLIFFGPI